MARDAVHQLLATDVVLDKLGAHGISAEEAEQLPRNAHDTVRNPRETGEPGNGGCSSAGPMAVACRLL
jgi:hypothetical protein